LKGYEGDKSQIGLLHSDIDSYKNQITDLKTQLNSYQGTDKSADELNALVNKLQSQNTSLKTQLANAKQKPQ
jgi:predicted  nucleic acid-binding Zn-ribbon protein